MATSMPIDTRMRVSGRLRKDIVAEHSSNIPLRGATGTGWDVANAAVFLACDETAFITGVELAGRWGSPRQDRVLGERKRTNQGVGAIPVF